MPRKSRAKDHIEGDMYDRDRDAYPRHSRTRDRRRIFREEEELRFDRRVPPPPPPPPPMAVPVEKLERLRLREERVRGGPKMMVPVSVPPPPPVAPQLVREEVKAMKPVRRPVQRVVEPREREQGFEKVRDQRGRTRYRGVDLEKERFVLEEEEEEEEEESDSESESSSLEESDTEEEEGMVVVPRKERLKQKIADEFHLPRGTDFKQGLRGGHHDPRLEEDDMLLKRHYERSRHGPVYAATQRHRHQHRSHRHKDFDVDGDSELDEELDHEEVVRRKYRERRRGGEVVEEEEEIRRSSSEMERARLPSPKRSPVYGSTVPNPRKIHHPRLSEPDLLYESETRRRERSSRGRRDRSEIPIIRPNKKSNPPTPHPDPYRRSKDSLPFVPPEPKIAERQKEVLTVVRRDGSHESFKEEEFVDEDYYAPPRHRSLPRKSQKEKEELELVGPAPRAKHDRTAPDHDALRYPERSPLNYSDDDSGRQFGRIGRRYVGVKDRRERLWTEITRDLVVKEALERAGYEYEETETSYFIFTYLEKEEVDALIEQSEDIRRARRRRVQEIHRERTSLPPPTAPVPPPPPPPPASEKTGPLLLDSPPPRFPREERWRTEREKVAEGGRWRPPPRAERW
ncbi:uncharacterized protein BP01DRAFT_353052 [Aspergillus saccharolyticus JOP 1030-1]|uniref:DUF8035 domain-containing protein n=1 Tax=Aspergillus saccharolyticus JOP 1030-1 TaxID=1450539 RepID=A0A319AQS9_9EURO|nr:hypothetical protein BP01DRAFT_353052 [Aspergillus saccharolyticus JOP 1030-1]PYH48742.1 hypothetical protein BP01DRAFT_353052 [Aspergillus saccharolyticus JOP 1030-1]